MTLSPRGYLLDVDGTLLVHDAAVPGAADVIGELERRSVPYRVITNITRRPRREIAATLARAGVAIPQDRVLCPAVLARERILASGRTRVGLLVPDSSREDLAGLDDVGDRPDWVVVADIGRGFTWERLNAAFAWLRGGARLLALHRNPWWDAGPPDGIVLDAGAFVAALELASGQSAEVVGKPSAAFFELALAALGLPAADVAVVGDDAVADIGGGAAVGCQTVLVRTGRFVGDPAALTPPPPSRVLPTVASLLD